jgi:hypothetical protein
MENKEKLIEQETKDSKEQSVNKVGGFIKSIGKGLVNTGKKVGEWTKDELEKIQDEIEFKKEFNKETHEFKVDGTSETLRGFKNPEENVVYVRVQDEKITKFVKSDSILVRTSDNLRLHVISVETKNVVNGSLNVKGENVPIALFALHTKPYEKEKISTVVNNVTQTLSISGSTIQGNVQQISDLTNKLNEFERQLRSFKPSIFAKSTYTEAVKIYGEVKELIINEHKDSPVVFKFIDLLGKLGGPLLSIFTTIIK